jgi:hypothetical protein
MLHWVNRLQKLSLLCLLCALPVSALPEDAPTPPTKLTEQCSPSETAVKAVEKDKAEIKARCDDANTKPEEQKALKGELKALSEVEKKLKEERLKVLFVDVNTVMETIETSMDWTANWLDGHFAQNEVGKNKAKAWGHVTFAWEPREGEMANFPMKFKVRAKLPNLQNKMEIILSDNEQEDFNNLPYETVRPEAFKSSQRSLGAAVRFLHSSSENISYSSRLGTGDGTMYARSAAIFRKKLLEDKVTLNAETALEYYVSDGWGARVLLDTGYAFSMRNEVRFNIAYRELESYVSPTWRKGLYHIGAISEKQAFISGLTVSGEIEPHYHADFYKASVRYRFNALRDWIYFEVEPFVEFIRDDPINAPAMNNEFVRDRGITFRFEAHYGFL